MSFILLFGVFEDDEAPLIHTVANYRSPPVNDDMPRMVFGGDGERPWLGAAIAASSKIIATVLNCGDIDETFALNFDEHAAAEYFDREGSDAREVWQSYVEWLASQGFVLDDYPASMKLVRIDDAEFITRLAKGGDMEDAATVLEWMGVCVEMVFKTDPDGPVHRWRSTDGNGPPVLISEKDGRIYILGNPDARWKPLDPRSPAGDQPAPPEADQNEEGPAGE